MKRLCTLILLAVFLPATGFAQVVINPAPVPSCINGDTIQYNGSSWVCTALGAGTIGGSGTTGKIPKFSAAQTLTDSILTEASTTVTATGNLAATGTLAVAGAITGASIAVTGAVTSATATLSGAFIAASSQVGNTGLRILDTNASHYLTVAPGSNITANRTLTVTTGDADRTLTISGNATIDATEVKGPASATDNSCARFDATTGKLIQDSSTNCTISDAGALAIASVAVTGALTAATSQVGNTGLRVLDTNASHYLAIAPGSNITANRTLTVTTGDADRTLTINASATLEGTEARGPASSTDNSCARFDSTTGKLLQDASSNCTIADTGVLTIKPTVDAINYNLIQNAAGSSFLNFSTSLRIVNITDFAGGTGAVTGPSMGVGRNTSGSGAAGGLFARTLSGGIAYLWPDTSSNWRTASALPEEDGTPSDTSGTVVGTQTSMRSTKFIDGQEVDVTRALKLILETPVYHFRYRNGAYGNTPFVGITTDDSPAFGMDPDPVTGQMRSFNPVNAFGYTVLAIQALQEQVNALKAQLATR